MSSFRFNFSNNEDLQKDKIVNNSAVNNPIKWIKSEQIQSEYVLNYNINDVIQHVKSYTCGTLNIQQVTGNEVMKSMQMSQNDALLADSNHSDLIPGKYEGGLKIWECTTDLLEYLMAKVDDNAWNEAKVLDLGCGAGILGIYAFINGSKVTFQDYNKEVLENVTIPNVLLNIKDKGNIYTKTKKCEFYTGDWESFNNLLDQEINYDFILTSETIYNEGNYGKIIDIFKLRLSDKSIAFIAAKTHYFGVGGGVGQFESYLRENGFNVKVCWKTVTGIQRKILEVTK